MDPDLCQKAQIPDEVQLATMLSAKHTGEPPTTLARIRAACLVGTSALQRAPTDRAPRQQTT